VGSVALPIVAVIVLHASTFQVSLLAALTAVTTLVLALPMGPVVEFRRKRPTLVLTDLVRFVTVASIPAAAALGELTFAHLCVVAVINAVCQIAFSAASQAHARDLVSREHLVDASSRLEGTLWLSLLVGPTLAGALIGVLTAAGALLVDAASFAASAVAVWRIRQGEPRPPVRTAGESRRAELVAGFRFVWAHPVLRSCLISWVLFAGVVMGANPLNTVFYLRTLHFSPLQYGLLMGLPCVGGFAGSRLVRRAVARFGLVRTMTWASLVRGPWQFLIPLAHPGTTGLVVCIVATTATLFCSAIANSSMNSYRLLSTPEHLTTRVASVWSFATTVAQPALVVAAGVIATYLGTRTTLLIAAALMSGAALLLPRREPAEATSAVVAAA